MQFDIIITNPSVGNLSSMPIWQIRDWYVNHSPYFESINHRVGPSFGTGHFRVAFCLSAKSLSINTLQNPLHDNVVPLQVHFHANQGFALALVLKQRHRVTRKWPTIQPLGYARLGSQGGKTWRCPQQKSLVYWGTGDCGWKTLPYRLPR